MHLATPSVTSTTTAQKNKGGNTKVKRTAAVTSDTTGFKGSVQGNSYNESACIELLA